MNERYELAAAETWRDKADKLSAAGRLNNACECYNSAIEYYERLVLLNNGNKTFYLCELEKCRQKLEEANQKLLSGNSHPNNAGAESSRGEYSGNNGNGGYGESKGGFGSGAYGGFGGENGNGETSGFGEKVSGGNKPAQTPKNESTGITFDDVAGLDDVKNEIRFKVIAPMQDVKTAQKYGIKAGGKILLYGPPGTGKTFIARAIAGEVDAKFFVVNCQDLISKYMGESSKQLDGVFAEAEKYDKAIIFFDEFDSVAAKRGDGTDGADGEMARFVATFLTRVDGFRPMKNKMLLLIAATNRPWALDSAMLRGGRFDTQIYVGVPDRTAREFLVKKVLSGIDKEDGVSLTEIAARLEGYGGGDVTSICEKIKLEPYKREVQTGISQKITRADVEKVISAAHNVITKEELKKFADYKNLK